MMGSAPSQAFVPGRARREPLTPERDVTAVIVAYNSAAVLPSCLESVANVAATIVVDNGSRDDCARVATRGAANARVSLIENGANVGFGRACNRGLAEVGTAFVLFVNPDVRLDPACVATLLVAAQDFPDAGIIGPALRNARGITAVTHDRSRLATRGGKPAPAPPDGPCCVEFLLGAALLCRTDVIRAVGGFDESVFLFYEDDDLCSRVRATGFSIVACPNATAVHLYSRSSEPTEELAAQKAWHMAWSRLYMVNKHRGRNAMFVEAALRIAHSGANVVRRFAALDSGGRRIEMARLRGLIGYLRGSDCFDHAPDDV